MFTKGYLFLVYEKFNLVFIVSSILENGRNCIGTDRLSDVSFKPFNSRKKFKQNKKHQKKTSEYDSIYITFNADHISKHIAQLWEECDGGHASPNNNAECYFPDSLTVLMLRKTLDSLIDHESRNSKDNYLIRMKYVGHKRDKINSSVDVM